MKPSFTQRILSSSLGENTGRSTYEVKLVGAFF